MTLKKEWNDCPILLPSESGMTLRDWFAGQALIAMAAKNYAGFAHGADPEATIAEVMASECYVVADAMMDARK